MKAHLDEMQKAKLLKLEERGFEICFLGLFLAIIIQLLVGCEWRQIIGEVIVLAAASLYLAVGTIKNGLWSSKTSPSFRGNALVSLIPAALIGILGAVKGFAISRLPFSARHVLAILLSMAAVYVLCLIVLEVMRRSDQKHRDRLDREDEEKEGE